MILERAIQLAAEAHRHQKDLAGEPYILHPLRVMLSLNTEEERIVGVLHDVIEDNPAYSVAVFQQRLGISLAICDALEALTRRNNERYETYINRLYPNDLARTIKIQDLLDNMDRTRIKDPTDIDVARWHKYERAWRFLTGIEDYERET